MSITRRENEFEVYIGTPVRITTLSHGSAMGIVHSLSSEYLSLKPALINHGTYNLDNKLIDNYKIRDKFPQKIKLANIDIVDPLDEGYIEELAKNLNYNSHPSRIIISKTKR